MSRVLAAAVLVLAACEAPGVGASPTPTSARVAASPTPQATPQPHRYALLYLEGISSEGATEVRVVSLNTGRIRDIAFIRAKRDGRFAIHPDGGRLAILEKEDHHVQLTTTWRVRLLDLADLSERDVIKERVDPEPIVPWDIGWTADGRLLLASRPVLERIDERDGVRTTLLRFPAGTIGVTFRDLVHPALVVSQTADTFSLYLVEGERARRIAERALEGVTGYARRPGSDEIVELVTRFDGVVAYALVRADGSARRFVLQGPRVEGLVELVGTTPEATFVLWPIAKDDPAALGTLATALLYRLGYDGRLELLDGVRNWGAFGPLGVSPDGRALLVPVGEKAESGASFAVEVCCERRPAPRLLGFGDRSVIGWLPER